jgi:hypothetical protein
MASWPEYNRLYAHPFEWTWTNQRTRRWFPENAAEFLALHYLCPATPRQAPREGDRHAFRAGPPLDEADRAGTGASADDGAQSIEAIAGPITGPMGTLGHPPQ